MVNTQHAKYSFIMPFFNRWELTLQRLNEFRKFLPDDCEIVLVDDCSTDESVKKGIAFWQKSGVSRHKLLYKRNTENVGFSCSMNNGTKVATGEIFVFYSNDVIMSGNIVPELDEKFTEKNILVGHQLLWWDTGWNKFTFNGKDRIVSYLGGYFIACSREDWKQLEWDERYAPYDYEDVDLSLQATILGYNLVEVPTPALKHLSGQTISKINPNREEITKRNRIKFIDKWSEKLREL